MFVALKILDQIEEKKKRQKVKSTQRIVNKNVYCNESSIQIS